MVKKVGKFLKGMKDGTGGKTDPASRGGSTGLKILKRGHAMRVIFFYPGEEGTYVDNAQVTLFENGIIHIESNQEETTTHLQNCEILWRFETENADDRASKVRLLKLKGESRGESGSSGKDTKDPSSGPDASEKRPER